MWSCKSSVNTSKPAPIEATSRAVEQAKAPERGCLTQGAVRQGAGRIDVAGVRRMLFASTGAPPGSCLIAIWQATPANCDRTQRRIDRIAEVAQVLSKTPTTTESGSRCAPQAEEFGDLRFCGVS